MSTKAGQAHPASAGVSIDVVDVVKRVQAEVFPYDLNLFRSAEGLATSRVRLDSLWRDVQGRPPPVPGKGVARTGSKFSLFCRLNFWGENRT
jgi:hypothetical protein